MHDIWNPWHGCKKITEGCDNCYMYFLDKQRGRHGSSIYKSKTNFNYPLKKNKIKEYKIKSGETINVCMTSDFFLEEADIWRDDVWKIIKFRSDVLFYLITKRVDRIKDCLPDDWGDGYDNVFLNVTCENQKRTDERVPILLKLPFKHKGISCTPILDSISLDNYLKINQIERVVCGGENYDGSRPCNFDWIKILQKECINNDINFCFMETGTIFIKDNKKYVIKSKKIQAEMAFKSNTYHEGKAINYKLTDQFGNYIDKNTIYISKFKEHCNICSKKLICNGCSNCGKCK